MDTPPRLTSLVCRRAHWDTPWFARWNAFFGNTSPPSGAFAATSGGALLPPGITYHRKLWEWAAIAQALHERGMLEPGRRGCGFAVGREPLACLFAKHGIDVLATDLAAADTSATAWSSSGQHAASLDALHWPSIIDRPTFDQHVRFTPQDMRALNPAELGTHDFIWSSCSFEHLGSLEAGLQFVLRSTELLRPGGIAVHTTELNLSSEDDTVSTGDSVIYRQKDLTALSHRLRLLGCGMEPLDPTPGTDPEDLEYDYEPYYENDRQHIKMLLGGFVTTSCLLIITKGRYPTHLPKLNTLRLDSHTTPGVKPLPLGPLTFLRNTPLWRATTPVRSWLRRRLK